MSILSSRSLTFHIHYITSQSRSDHFFGRPLEHDSGLYGRQPIIIRTLAHPNVHLSRRDPRAQKKKKLRAGCRRPPPYFIAQPVDVVCGNRPDLRQIVRFVIFPVASAARPSVPSADGDGAPGIATIARPGSGSDWRFRP